MSKQMEQLALMVAMAGAKMDEMVIAAAKKAVAAIDVTEEDVKRVEAYTPEQKVEEIARRRAIVEQLHDAACEWLEVDERTDRVMAQINSIRSSEPNAGDALDFGSVFGEGLK